MRASESCVDSSAIPGCMPKGRFGRSLFTSKVINTRSSGSIDPIVILITNCSPVVLRKPATLALNIFIT
jgi:hypothetical protein